MSNATEVITFDFGGKTFRTGRRTAAHLLWTQKRLDKKHPGARIRVIQPSYNTGVPESAGTHDKDAVLDVEIEGLGWWEGQRFLRESGWADWYRYPPTFSEHHHMISLGYGDAPVGVYVPGQVDDYYRHALGLKGQHNSGADDSWFPADIKSTIFDYQAWLDEENDMQLNDKIYGDSAADDTTVGKVLRRLDAFIDREDKRAAVLKEKVNNLTKAVNNLPEGATKAQIKTLLESIDAEINLVVTDTTP
jgi:hypothetical protein